MKKKVIRYFVDFLNSQESWLNKMAKKGFRLVNTSKLLYEFEQCTPNEYEYNIEFVAHMSDSKRREYKEFLEDAGYNVLIKNINLNYSIGKVRWRPWANAMGQITTSPGSYNKELLIIERKKDSKPFKLHTDLVDLISYVKSISKFYLFTSILLITLIILNLVQNTVTIFSMILSSLLSILIIHLLLKTFIYSKMLSNYKKQSQIYE